MAVIIFVDTNIVSLLMRGNAAVRRHWHQTSSKAIHLSTIVIAEGLTGAYRVHTERYRMAWQDLADDYMIVPFDAVAADAYAQLRASLERQGQMIGHRDFQIAATALAWQAIHPGDQVTLVTANTTEFARVPGLRVENWSK